MSSNFTMEIFNVVTMKWIFQIICCLATLFAIGFWAHKFQKNEDVSQIQYIAVKTLEEVIHPETTICILKPFAVQAFNENVNISDYLEYLDGNRDPDEKYKNIKFSNVTVNIFDYVKYPPMYPMSEWKSTDGACVITLISDGYSISNLTLALKG